MRKVLASFLFSLLASCGMRPLYAQIAVTGAGTQSVILNSPTPISCPTAATKLTCTAPAPTIQLPVEIFGPAGTVSSVTVDLATAPPAGTVLYLQIHGLRYQSEASVQVNNSVWLPLSTAPNSGVTLQGQAAAYGGIGGGFATISLTVTLPAGVIAAGANTISLRFNGTDGVSSGYRVLALNFQSAGVTMLPPTAFVQTNPAGWTPPLNDAADIAAGLKLWQTAALSDPATGASVPITAHCADCHTLDGRDLKYFNYSNLSIEARASFHGLTAIQGQQIASYIRSLTTPAPGLPWSPPYQPGFGMDAAPVSAWSAGAGLAAVLAGDAALQPSLANMAATAYLNPRTTPLPLQFPDWNGWLPQVWPGDAYGATFTTGAKSPLVTYQAVRAALAPATAAAYKAAAQASLSSWISDTGAFLQSIETTTANYQAVNSVAQWRIVKHWELNQSFGLEGMASAVFPKPNPRAWLGNPAFNMEPAELHIPRTGALMNGLASTWEYMDNVWNFLQFVLNDGQGTQAQNSPLDYGYLEGDVKDLSIASGNTPQAMLELYVLIKALQEYTLNGAGPQVSLSGFAPSTVNPAPLADPSWQSDWMGYPAALQGTLATQYIQAWFNQLSTYAPAQFYAGKDGGGRPWATATENCATDSVTTFGGSMWMHMPRFRAIGVNAVLLTDVYGFLVALFPATNWTPNIAATCNVTLGTCTSDAK